MLEGAVFGFDIAYMTAYGLLYVFMLLAEQLGGLGLLLLGLGGLFGVAGEGDEGRAGSDDGRCYQDVGVHTGHGVEGLTGSGGYGGVLGQQQLGSGVGFCLEGCDTLHDGTLFLEGVLDLGESDGDGHGGLQFGDDLDVITQLYTQELGGSLEGLEGGGGQADGSGNLVKDTGIGCGMVDGCLDVGHGVTYHTGTLGELVDAPGECLTKGALFLGVGEGVVLDGEVGDGFGHLTEGLCASLGHGVHLTESLDKIKHSVIEVLQCAACLATAVHVTVKSVSGPLELVIVLLVVNPESK